MKIFLIILEIIVIIMDFCFVRDTNALYDIYTWCAGFLAMNVIIGIPLFVIYSFFNYVLKCLDKLRKDDVDEHVVNINNKIGDIYYQMGKYDEALDAYNTAIDIEKTSEIAIENREKVLKILDEENSNLLLAKSYFHNAENLLTKQKYEEAIENINKAISLDSSNEDYLKLLDVINEETNKHLARAFYQKSLKCLKDGDFDQSIINIKQALELYPNNKTYQKILSKANSRMIDIKTCTKNAILTLEGFDNEKAELFINERKTMTWYDLDSFAKYFDLQPHERILLEDKLIFPKKPLVKKGRTLEY